MAVYIINQFTGTRYGYASLLPESGHDSPIEVLTGKELRQLHGEMSTKPDFAAGDMEDAG